MLCDANVFNWTDACSAEARALGSAATYSFEAYLRFLDNPLYKPGCCSTNPIVLEDTAKDMLIGASGCSNVAGGSVGVADGDNVVVDAVMLSPWASEFKGDDGSPGTGRCCFVRSSWQIDNIKLSVSVSATYVKVRITQCD